METKRIVVPGIEEILGRYFPVLDHGFVSVVDYFGGDLSIERAARCSYNIGNEDRTLEESEKLLRHLFRNRHSSPFEMAGATLHVGLPIFSMRQLVRHRTLSLNEYSGRYSVMPLMYYTPSEERLSKQSKTNKQGSGERVSRNEYARFMEANRDTRDRVSENYIHHLQGDISKELARIDLPLSTYTYCYIETDLRNLFHLIGLRSDSHAQAEIRDYSDIFAGVAQRLAPLSFRAFEDYQMYSVTFSQAEMAAIRVLGHYHVSPVTWANFPQDIRQEVNQTLHDHGVRFTPSGRESREQGEFWAKMAPKTRRDFTLDVAEAREASFFMDEVQKYAQ